MLVPLLFLPTKFCFNVELETESIEKDLDPSRQLLRDSAAMAILQLDELLDNALGYITHQKSAMVKIDKELLSGKKLHSDMESLMDRLNAIPSQVQSWERSVARSGADMALSLIRIHYKDVDDARLKSLKVVNKKKFKFEDFMEMFIEVATLIVDDIDLDTFVHLAVLCLMHDQKTFNSE